VRTEHATRPLTEPRSRGDLRRRLLRHHLPLAVASAVVLLLFMGLPRFDASKYPQADIFSGTFPREFAAGEAGQHGGGQAGPMEQGGGHQPPQQGGGHQPPQQGRGHQPLQQQGESQAPSVSPSAEEVEDRSFRRRFTVATGYVALALLALTLLIGPANLVLRKRNPVSSYLRRDVGAWTALFSGVHVIVSLMVHGSGQISHFFDFFVADGSPLGNSFGLGNWTGLAALVIVALLLGLSSDAALRKLKAKNWKRLQRLNYALFALVIVHAFFYGALLRETSPYTILLLLSVIAVVVGQAVGVWLFRRRYSRRTPVSA
jgi:sulfoxide reductase heme-binding subunit YedZ